MWPGFVRAAGAPKERALGSPWQQADRFCIGGIFWIAVFPGNVCGKPEVRIFLRPRFRCPHTCTVCIRADTVIVHKESAAGPVPASSRLRFPKGQEGGAFVRSAVHPPPQRAPAWTAPAALLGAGDTTRNHAGSLHRDELSDHRAESDNLPGPVVRSADPDFLNGHNPAPTRSAGTGRDVVGVDLKVP